MSEEPRSNQDKNNRSRGPLSRRGRSDADESGRDESNGSGGEQGSGGAGGSGGKPPNLLTRGALTWVLLLGVAVSLLLLMQSTSGQASQIAWSEFVNLAGRDPSAFEGEIVIQESKVVGELREGVDGLPEGLEPGSKVSATINPNAVDSVRYKLEDELGQRVAFEVDNNVFFHLLFSFGPIILIALLIYFVFFRAMRSAGGGAGMLGNFGRSKHRVMNKEHSNVVLDDVAGIDEAKEEVTEIIEFLKNPKKFQRLGGRVPRGVLLIGNPGCGKTLLAKAVAGEADVPFFSISGSDFVEMFVGVGASRVRDLFKQAKDSSPCIIFLDEIDAVGRRRGRRLLLRRSRRARADAQRDPRRDGRVRLVGPGHRRRLDQPRDVLDPALTRPGRFDRQIHVPLPDIKGRMEMLKVHSEQGQDLARTWTWSGWRGARRCSPAPSSRRSSTKPRSSRRCRTRTSSRWTISRRRGTR